MERAKAWELFCREMQPYITACREEFTLQLSAQSGELRAVVLRLIEQAKKEWESSTREAAVYFYFSLLKVDILKHQYTLALQVMDDHWHLDQQAIELYDNLDFLFQPFDRLFEQLNNKRQIFIGKIDEYDIQGLMFDELTVYSSTIAHYLRYLLRDLELEGDYWVIRWGEYESDTEIIRQQDLQPKSAKEWKRSLLQSEESPQWLAGSYWYQLDIRNFDCHQKNVSFMYFNQCMLQDITFDQCDMIGARFDESQLDNCSFVSADLRDADFSRCRGKQLDFTNANVAGALFCAAVIEGSNLTEEQIRTVYVKEE